MATEFNIDPYYDDFKQNAKENNYVKILFKPGVSVQARELTQIQSILQNQIKSFGDHIFQDGSPVIGGNLSLDNTITYVKLDDTFNNEDIELDQFNGRVIIRDSDGLVQAKVLATYFPAGGSPTIMVKYVSGVEFQDGDIFRVAGTTRKAKCIDALATGRGTVVSINEGIFYVDGYFIEVSEQTAVVSAYSQLANAKIGLEITDEVVDYVVDSTLLDPAQESFNYQAPGADRYQFNLSLSTRPLETAVDESSFFELMRVESGAITKQVKYPIYSEIEKTLARRTYDESGDYTVIPFRASVAKSQNATNYIINIEPGKAYVKGFEFETLGTFKMEVPKPRGETDKKSLVDIDYDTSYGNYIKVKDLYGPKDNDGNTFIDISNLEKVDLHCVDTSKVAVGHGTATSTAIYANTKIGTARIRNIKRDRASGESTYDSSGVYNIYLTDINIESKTAILAGGTSTSITLPANFSAATNAYQNVTVTILPVQYSTVSAAADLYANGLITTTGAAFTGTVDNGDVIRISDYTREVVNVAADGNSLRVNSGFVANITGQSLDVYVESAYSSGVTGQTRKIISYNGGSRVATLDRAFDEGAVAISGEVVQLNYSLKDMECLMEANAAGSGVVNASANISVQSRLINGDVSTFENDDKVLVYRLPKSYVKRGNNTVDGIDNVDYNFVKYQSINSTVSSRVFRFTLEAHETIPWSVTESNARDNLIVVARQDNGAGPDNGEILVIPAANVDTSPVNGVDIDTGFPDLVRIDVYCVVKNNDAEARKRTKQLKSNTLPTLSPFNYPIDTDLTTDYTVSVPAYGTVAKINANSGMVFITDPSFTNIYPGDSISLFIPDAIKVRKILKGNTTNLPDVDNYEDVTDHFLVDYGQKDDIYDHAKLILKQGYPTPNARMTVHLDFFNHTRPSGADSTFFCVDSYAESIDEAGETPIYYSSKNGVFNLRDCLDFRPTRQIGVSTGAIQTCILPAPDVSTELSFEYYLPRIDKLVLSKTKEFKIIQGVSAPKPVAPPDQDDSMTLYVMYLPPYVNDVNDIRLQYIENKRYTMKDIAKIDKRVDRIEYYTALNSIENKAFDDTSQYEDGTEKEKFGIIGENFRNYNIADYRNPDFNCSMVRNALTPFFKNRVNGTRLISTSNATENEKTITMAYTEVPAVVQGVATEKVVTVQPFLFGTFLGDLRITPDVDYWVSTDLKPEIIRGPEYTKEVNTVTKTTTEIIKEINTTQVIVERVKERTVIVTVPAPAVNNSPALTEVPRTDPPPPRPEDERPVLKTPPPPVVVDEPTPPPPPAPQPDPEPEDEVLPDIIAPIIMPADTQPEEPTYEAPAPEPEVQATITPEPIVASSTSTASFSGGGCVALESFVPVVAGNSVNGQPVRQAYQVARMHKLLLCDLSNLLNIEGSVKDSFVDYQLCHNIITESGASLICSDTAPIPTLEHGIKHPPELVGKSVPVLRNDVITWERVVSNESVGYKFVKVIDAHDNYFWAGATEDAFILHHNIISQFRIQDLSYDKK